MQANVTLCTNEKDLKIVLGPMVGSVEYSNKPRELAFSSVRYLYTDLNDIRRNYIRLGFHLNEFERCSYYLDFGYTSLADFANANLGMDKSAVSRCISVYRTFAKRGDSKLHNDHAGPLTMFIDDKYADYSYSQLCEMVSMSEEMRRKVKPDMSIKQIREIKKENKCFTENKNVSQVATSQLEEEKDNSKILKLHGAALQTFVKKCDCSRTIFLNLFDPSGKSVSGFFGIPVDLIYNDDDSVFYLRLSYDMKKNDG